MASDSRALTLKLLADVADFQKKIDGANNDVEGFSSKIGKFSKVAAAAFAAAAAAAAAYATKLAVDGVKSAIEDELAQKRLAEALGTATGATQDQIAAVEKQIQKFQLAYGVSDQDLRPALQRLALSTNDVTKAQDILSTALDVAAATGKPLEQVTNALSKSYDGSNGALSKLGVGLSAAELKTMSFKQVQDQLNATFGGAAAANATTFQGRIDRLKQAFSEAQESIGYALLPVLEKLLGYVTDYLLPIVEKFTDSFTGGEGLSNALNTVVNIIKSIVIPIFNAYVGILDKVKNTIVENKENFQSFFDFIKAAAPIIGKVLGTAISIIGDIANVVLDLVAKVLGAITPMINFAIDGINKVITGINFIKPGADIAYIPKIGSTTSTGGASQFVKSGANAVVTTPVITPTITTPKVTSTDSTSQMASVSASVSAVAAGMNLSNSAKNALPTIQNYINVTGAIDPEATARQILDILNQSSSRGGAGSNTMLVA